MRRPWLTSDRIEGLTVERALREPGPLDRFATALIARLRFPWRRAHPRLSPLIWQIRWRARRLRALDDEALKERAQGLRMTLRSRGFTRRTLREAFALAMEATRRERGIVLHAVQIAGGLHILKGRLCEMATGEGKTITAVLPTAAAALAGARVHVVTVNEYLAARDCEEVGPIHARLGLEAGLIQQAMPDEEKAGIYGRDVVYVTSQALAFDYLRDRIDFSRHNSTGRARVSRLFGLHRRDRGRIPGLVFAVVDEADSVLIDEARTPLVIAGEIPGDAFAETGRRVLDIARSLTSAVHYRTEPATSRIRLTEEGRALVRAATEGLDRGLSAFAARDELVERALTALHLFQAGQHYIVAEGEVQIVDEATGRVMPDRKWEQGLHQFVELKENLPVSARRETLKQITFQRFFRKYLWFGGMTGTARPVAREIDRVYGVRTVCVPTHARPRRRQFSSVLCGDDAEKWRRVVAEAQRMAARGRPVLIGTRSVEASEALKAVFDAAAREATLLNARHDAEEAAIIAAAGRPGRITIATNMAGRGTDIKLDPAAREAGGLHVILTEFHESARVDRQLFGRSGRQGDPGSAIAIVALTDALFLRYAPRATRTAALLPRPVRWLVADPLSSLLRVRAQGRAERLAALSRLQTLKADEQLEKGLSFAGGS
jgi:preprotein translocase subunit SecA